MSFVEVHTSNLIGPALDWAVAKCEGFIEDGNTPCEHGYEQFAFSTDWTQGGPIIDREGIATRKHSGGTWYAMTSLDLGDGERAQWCEFSWRGVPSKGKARKARFSGPTRLVAAMRCYVAFKLGDTVQIPKELLIPERIT